MIEQESNFVVGAYNACVLTIVPVVVILGLAWVGFAYGAEWAIFGIMIIGGLLAWATHKPHQPEQISQGAVDRAGRVK